MSSLPIINNYDDLVNFNNSIPASIKTYNIEQVSYTKDTIIVNGKTKGLDSFLHYYVLHPHKLTGKVSRLKQYDYTKLLCLTHPDLFMEQLKTYANNILLLGETSFLVWDFEITIEGDDIILKEYKNDTKKEVSIPFFITKIDHSAFQWKDNIKTVTFQEGSRLKCIGREAFEKCLLLRNVNLPDSLEEIKYGAFASTSIKTLILPNNLKKIGESAFDGCHHLEKVTFNSNLKSICKGAFLGCIHLKKILLPHSLEMIDGEAFRLCESLESAIIPDSVIVLGRSVFSSCKNLKSVTLGKGITTIPYGSFEDCNSLEELNILGDKVETIGRFSLDNTNIKELVLPKSLEPFLMKMGSHLSISREKDLTSAEYAEIVRNTVAKFNFSLRKVSFR